MVQVQAPWFTVFVVTLAALIYCSKALSEYLRQMMRSVYARYGEQVNALHNAVRNEIDVPFEFWWTGEPEKIVRDAVLKELPISDEDRASVPDAVIDELVDRGVSWYHGTAFHLALHARMGARERGMIRKAPRALGLRALALEAHKEHGLELDEERRQLAEIGIDVNQLESEFSAA